MKMLVVDDDEVSSLLLGDALADLGYEVSVAFDGIQGWNFVKTGEYPVVILDWVMPGLDGIELTRRIRQNLDGAYVYVVLLTGRTEREDRLLALEAGADDFLTKPVDHAELVAKLRVAERILASEAEQRALNEALMAARRSESELGGQIQRRLLMGRAPDHMDGLQIAMMSVPSQAIDGDFCDFFRHGGDVLDLVAGDVMGKGIPAALVGAGVKTSLQHALVSLLSAERGGVPGVDRIVGAWARSVSDELIELGTFLTLAYARVHGHGLLEYTNCGHPRMVKWDSRLDCCELLDLNAPPVGFLPDMEISCSQTTLRVGDLAVIYSDGVTDLWSGGERLGVDGFASWLAPRAGKHLDSIIDDLQALHGDASQPGSVDDFTVVLIRLVGPGADADGTTWYWSDGAVGRIRQAVLVGARQVLDQDSGTDLMLAAQEVASNAVRHARKQTYGLPIGVRRRAVPNGFGVDILYPGAPFEPGEIRDLLPDENRSGGFGLPLIRKAVDHVAYGRESDLNVVSLEKYATDGE